MINFEQTHWYKCESMCEACPFNCTEQQEMAYNLGCLPSPSEIMQLCKETNLNWSCHEQDGKLCTGFVAVSLDMGYDFKHKKMLSTDTYLKTGEIKEVEKW